MVRRVGTNALQAATPWGTFNPLILDPIWMVLAAIAVQIPAIWDLAARIAEDRKPLYLARQGLLAQITRNSLSGLHLP